MSFGELALSPSPSCAYCNASNYDTALFPCNACKVVHYCDRQHQAVHRDYHQEACRAIFRSQMLLDHEEAKLRSGRSDWPALPNVFEREIGNFWVLARTRDYMRARNTLIEALLMVKTHAAVEAAHGHCMDMLRLSRCDKMAIREKVPGLKLRLGKEQECYDFCKWWATTNGEGECDWNDMSNPYLDFRDAQIYEPPLDIFGDLHHCVAVTLIKIRLLKFVRDLPNLSEAREGVRFQPATETVVAENERLISAAENQAIGIEMLEQQIEQLHEAVDDMNRYLWNGFLWPANFLDYEPEPGSYDHGSVLEMRVLVQHFYDAWMETPGALDKIRELEGEDSESETEETEEIEETEETKETE